MPRRPWICVLSLGFAAILAGRAHVASAEEGGGWAFEWRAPEGCPSTLEVEEEIGKLLGGPAREHTTDTLHVQAVVEHGAAWFVTLETESKTASGHRTIEAATCQGLVHATALIVALMIDPDAVAARSGKKPPSPAIAPPAEPANRRGERATLLLIGTGAAGNLGVLPEPDIGASVSVGAAHPRWRVEARAAYGPRQVRSETLANPQGAYGRFSFVAGTLSGCMTFARSRLELAPCASVEAGAVLGKGFGATRTTAESSPWFGLGVGGFLAIKVNAWLYFPIHADAVVPLWRPHYVFQNVPTPIFQSWPVGARLTAGVELRF